MLLLTRETGQPVASADGRAVGRCIDLTVRLGHPHGPHLVERLLVRRPHRPDLLVPWAEVAAFEHTEVRLRQAGQSADGDGSPLTRVGAGGASPAIAPDELLLTRDVLDTQIVDVVGQRLARVSDVVMTRTGDDRLALVGVEVGLRGVLRRLGLRRLSERTAEDVVAWSDLHLTSERGHAVQLSTPRSAVHHLDAAALAALLARLDTTSAAEVLATKGEDVAADVVLGSLPEVGERVLRAMPPEHASRIVAAMPERSAHHWRRRLAHEPPLRGRHLLRSRVLRRPDRRSPPAPPSAPDASTDPAR